MAGEPQERIGVEIVVQDNGTPAVKRHTEETKKALGEVERASKRSSAEVSGGMQKAAVATQGLGQTMEKSRAAAMALAGGLSQAGGRASQAAAAISTLVVTGLNPLGLALAASSVAIGIWVSHSEAAKKNAEEWRVAQSDLNKELALSEDRIAAFREGRSPNASLSMLKDLEELSRKLRELRLERASGSVSAKLDREFPGMGLSAQIQKLEQEEHRLRMLLNQAGRESSAIDAMRREREALAETTAFYAQLARVRARVLAPGAVDFSGEEILPTPMLDALRAKQAAFSKGAIGAGNLVGEQAIRFQTPQVGGDRVVPDGFSQPGMPSLGGLGFGTLGSSGEMADRARALDRRDIWMSAGNRAGDAMAEGISESLSTAVLSGRFDLADLGRTMGETLVRTFMDALVQAAIGDQMRTALQSLFMSLGGAVGLGGPAGAPGVDPATNSPVFTPSAGARGPAVFVAVEPAPVMGERVLRSASDEAVRARVSVAYQGQGAPGRRA